MLTETEARRLFGAKESDGQDADHGVAISTDYRITGIARDVARNSHVRFDIVARVDMPAFWAETPDFLTSWGWQSGWFYFTLQPGTTCRHPGPDGLGKAQHSTTVGNQTFNQGDEQDFRLANISDIHLGEAQEATMSPGNDRSTIVTFTIIAFLILGMACINFTNLATARASQRARGGAEGARRQSSAADHAVPGGGRC